ncbi:MAG: hypothetical protein AB2A00_24955 [Myxococcota bacterium]
MLTLCTLVMTLAPSAAAAPSSPPPPVVTAANLAFHSAFWPNLHHTLYVAAWSRRPRTGERPMAGTFPEPLGGTLTREEQTAWDAAVAYYDRELASHDLLFHPPMSPIRMATISSGETLVETELPKELATVLKAAAPVYQRHWWPLHDKANRAWIADMAARIIDVAPEVTGKLAGLYGTPWFAEPIRVDVVRTANVQGAYTGTRGMVHITVAGGDAAHAGWGGVEILFHEASHALVGPLRTAIDTQLEKAGKRAPELWHVVLFYVAGEVVKQTLARRKVAYTQYLYSTGLFDKAWPQHRKNVESHVPAFIDGKLTREQLAQRLSEGL